MSLDQLSLSPQIALEIVGAVVGILSVAALSRGDGRGWPLGVVWILITGYLYWCQEVWGQVALSLYFLVAQLVGFWRWLRGSEPDLRKSARSLTTREKALTVLVWAAATFGLVFLLRAGHGKLVVLDALTTVGSLIGQALMVMGLAESWLIYLVVDVIYVLLSAKAGMGAYLAMYLVYCALAWQGWREWTRDGRDQKRNDAPQL